uniref:ODAD1 central coiled coil region domain-containing protein n=1 Tax=Ficedula albicollis TaxID=59894 RepID=U3K322_FICAL
MEKKIVKQRDTTWRVWEAKSHKQLQKKIELLEMHLNHVTVRYNTIMTRNNQLREETVSMQIQKAIYDNSYWKLEERLAQQNSLLNAAIEQATEDYEQWMEDLGRISDIRGVRYRETIQYNIRLLERKCVLHQETRLKNFFLAKCTDLSALKEEARKREAFEAAERAKRSQKESYEVAYKRLLELSDGDIDNFLEDFLEKDRRFFILFSYAIRLNVRNEGLRQRIQEIQVCSWLLLREQVETTRKTAEEANMYENKCKESSSLLGQLQSRVETLLKDMDCDTSVIVKPLGESLMPIFGRSGLPIFLGQESFPNPLAKPCCRMSFPAHPLQPVLPCVRPVEVCIMGWRFSWAEEEPLDWVQLRQLVLQRQQEVQERPPSPSKRRRRPGSKSPPQTGTN